MRIELLERALGYRFNDKALLQQAVTHRSYGAPHNERLEFLGDSMLNCVITTQLYQRFPALREGELSRLRANLVCQDTLHQQADRMKLGDFLRLGEGELKSGGFRRPSILADAFEAILGGIYLDGGYAAVETVVSTHYSKLLDAIDPKQNGKDPKTLLQEVLQGSRLSPPAYRLLTTHGEAHAQEFEVECDIAALGITTRGRGTSRRGAEQTAAKAALDSLPEKIR